MSRHELVTKIKDKGLVAVVRTESAEKAYRITEACIEGGVVAVEITFTVPGANKIIEDLAAKYSGGEIILGAGTVLDSETARIAILSGAQYIVSPYFSHDVIKLCNRYQIPSMPGAMTIKEIVEAMEAGADIIKIFPGNLFGPAIIKSVKGPIPQAQMMPTGGVSLGNVKEWIEAGAVAIGAGSSLTNGAKTGDYAAVTATAKEFIKRIKEARGE